MADGDLGVDVVTDFGADPEGKLDSTMAFQCAMYTVQAMIAVQQGRRPAPDESEADTPLVIDVPPPAASDGQEPER